MALNAMTPSLGMLITPGDDLGCSLRPMIHDKSIPKPSLSRGGGGGASVSSYQDWGPEEFSSRSTKIPKRNRRSLQASTISNASEETATMGTVAPVADTSLISVVENSTSDGIEEEIQSTTATTSALPSVTSSFLEVVGSADTKEEPVPPLLESGCRKNKGLSLDELIAANKKEDDNRNDDDDDSENSTSTHLTSNTIMSKGKASSTVTSGEDNLKRMLEMIPMPIHRPSSHQHGEMDQRGGFLVIVGGKGGMDGSYSGGAHTTGSLVIQYLAKHPKKPTIHGLYHNIPSDPSLQDGYQRQQLQQQEADEAAGFFTTGTATAVEWFDERTKLCCDTIRHGNVANYYELEQSLLATQVTNVLVACNGTLRDTVTKRLVEVLRQNPTLQQRISIVTISGLNRQGNVFGRLAEYRVFPYNHNDDKPTNLSSMERRHLQAAFANPFFEEFVEPTLDKNDGGYSSTTYEIHRKEDVLLLSCLWWRSSCPVTTNHKVDKQVNPSNYDINNGPISNSNHDDDNYSAIGFDSDFVSLTDCSTVNGSVNSFPPQLCEMGCGFFGSEYTGNCCSKCWGELLQEGTPRENMPLDEEHSNPILPSGGRNDGYQLRTKANNKSQPQNEDDCFVATRMPMFASDVSMSASIVPPPPPTRHQPTNGYGKSVDDTASVLPPSPPQSKCRTLRLELEQDDSSELLLKETNREYLPNEDSADTFLATNMPVLSSGVSIAASIVPPGPPPRYQSTVDLREAPTADDTASLLPPPPARCHSHQQSGQYTEANSAETYIYLEDRNYGGGSVASSTEQPPATTRKCSSYLVRQIPPEVDDYSTDTDLYIESVCTTQTPSVLTTAPSEDAIGNNSLEDATLTTATLDDATLATSAVDDATLISVTGSNPTTTPVSRQQQAQDPPASYDNNEHYRDILFAPPPVDDHDPESVDFNPVKPAFGHDSTGHDGSQNGTDFSTWLDVATSTPTVAGPASNAGTERNNHPTTNSSSFHGTGSVLVLGASGRIGSLLVQCLAAHDTQPKVYGFCRDPCKMNPYVQNFCVQTFQGNARDSNDLERALVQSRANVVVVCVGNGDSCSKTNIRTECAQTLVNVLHNYDNPALQQVQVIVISRTDDIRQRGCLGRICEYRYRHILRDHEEQKAIFQQTALWDRTMIVQGSMLFTDRDHSYYNPTGGGGKNFAAYGNLDDYSPIISTSRSDFCHWLTEIVCAAYQVKTVFHRKTGVRRSFPMTRQSNSTSTRNNLGSSSLHASSSMPLLAQDLPHAIPVQEEEEKEEEPATEDLYEGDDFEAMLEKAVHLSMIEVQ